jgi:vancomycin resistance protein YoaR
VRERGVLGGKGMVIHPDRRGALLAVAGVAVLLGGLYLCGWLFVGGTVPSGTRVADVDIGGLSPDDAEQRLETELADRAAKPIELSWQGQTFELDPRRAGLRFDVEETVKEAGGGRSWNPLQMVDTLLNPDNVSPVVDVDEKALYAALERLADRVDEPPAEPVVSFDADGQRRVSYSKSGHTIDQEAVASDIVAAYLRSDKPVQLRIDAIETTSEVADISRAISTLAKPAMSGPIRLQLPNQTVQLTVPEFAPALSLRFRDGELRPSFNVDRLRQTTTALRARVGVEPQNARVVLRRGRPAIVAARSGLRLDPARLAEAIAPVLAEKGPARSARIRLSEWRAGFGTEDARRLGIRRVVSSSTTYYPSAPYRNVNLRRAASRLNGTVLWSGESFSFNQTVGPRTRANGFVKGYVLRDGRVTQDRGGGVSQASTTTFNAAFFAGLKQIRRVPHAYYVDRYPVGRDAVVGPSVDLRFVNTTPYGVLIQAWIVPGTPGRRGEMHVQLWSTKYWNIKAGQSKRHNVRPPHRRVDRSRPCHAQRGQPGFEIDVYRVFRRAGSAEVHHKETTQASYRPVNGVVCRVSRGRRG